MAGLRVGPVRRGGRMTGPRWIMTPRFLDMPDPDLFRAAPPGVDVFRNEIADIADRAAASLLRVHAPIASFVQRCAEDGVLAVSVAGDCVASLPVMAGLQRAGVDPVLVWLDAHGDFNTPETSPSGFLGGMPLAMMTGRGDQAIARGLGLAALCDERVWLIGARDLDPGERRMLDASRLNRAEVEALETLVLDGPVHLHVDNDVIDASDVPANNYPVPGGPALGRVIDAVRAFAAANRLCAVSLSGWNGRLDSDGRTGRACADLLATIIEATGRRGA